MTKFIRNFCLIAFITIVSACSASIPIEYKSQSFVSLPNAKASIGEFSYKTALEGKVKTNQIQNTAIGNVLIGEDVSNYVRRATALELRNANVKTDGFWKNQITGQIDKFLVDDLGFSARWKYIVTYSITNKSTGKVKFKKTYMAKERTSSKFGLPSDFTSIINLLILDGIEQFMNDIRLKHIL